MRNFIMLAAAASVLGGVSFAAPALANPGAVCDPFVLQSECAFDFEWKSHSDQTIDQTQTIDASKYAHLFGLLQQQFGLNVSVKAGGDQDITQTQTLTLHHHDDAIGGTYPFFAPTQNQTAVNVQYKADVDQSITQTQTIDSHNDVYGPVQNQTAVNIAVESHGGSQTITQSQGITLH